MMEHFCVVRFLQYEDYFLWILIFAVGSDREKEFQFYSAKIAQLDFPMIDKLWVGGGEVGWGEKSLAKVPEMQRIKRYLQADQKTDKNSRFTYRRLNKKAI